MKKTILCLVIVGGVLLSAQVTSASGSFRLQLDEVHQALFEGDFSRALQGIDRAMKVASDPAPELLAYRALILTLKGREGGLWELLSLAEENRRLVEKALQKDPTNFMALFVRGSSQVLTPEEFGGDPFAGEKTLEKAVTSFPQAEREYDPVLMSGVAPYLFYTLGRARLYRGDSAGALKAFEESQKRILFPLPIEEEVNQWVTTLTLYGKGLPIENISIRGNAVTRGEVVISLLGFPQGKRYSEEWRQNATRKLLATGLFESVEVHKGSVKNGTVDILVEVVEVPPIQWNYL